MIVRAVVQQHADDVAMLIANRISLVRGPYARLERINQFDRRLKAHLAGLRLSGDDGRAICEAALETPSSGAIFAVAVGALEEGDDQRLARLVAFAEAVPELTAGLLAAFGWVDRSQLQGVVARMLRDPGQFNRMIAVAVCAVHRVDPGIGTGRLLDDPAPPVRARALRAVGELGLANLLTSCTAALADEDEECAFWAAWSAVLVGNRHRALDALTSRAFKAGPHRERALRLVLQTLPVKQANATLQRFAADGGNVRWLIHGSGIVGDPAYVPWLIAQMQDLKLARLAAEAVTFITGLDLGADAMDLSAPEGFEIGPTDDPDDPDVAVDPDDGLPWPDTPKIEAWWSANARHFETATRHFMGEPLSRARCVHVLKQGRHRQRMLAAHHLCLLHPGTPLFNTSAPAWRQQTLLAQLA